MADQAAFAEDVTGTFSRQDSTPVAASTPAMSSSRRASSAVIMVTSPLGVHAAPRMRRVSIPSTRWSTIAAVEADCTVSGVYLWAAFYQPVFVLCPLATVNETVEVF